MNADPTRVIEHNQRSLFRGFTVPDGLIFLDEKNGREYLLAWLVIRTSWMSTLTGFERRQTALPNPQQWRIYLRQIGLEYKLVRKNDRQSHLPNPTGTSRAGCRKQKCLDSARDIFTAPKPNRDFLTSISWNHHIVWTKGSINLEVMDYRVAVWDVQEHNFRAELFSLDRCIMRDLWNSPWLERSREQKVQAVFFSESTVMVSLPSGFKSIASELPADRCSFVEAFRRLLADWPGETPRSLAALEFRKQVDGEEIWNFDVMHVVERMAFSFYCQTFFDYFGRAPTIPHTYPV